ncbi:multi protein bridging factor 1 [Xylona heveae TC161]|uniref:Multiprotein-bridging factor 1 n=1 Tax=Xylona heveae (strain CBS 132557 / TC161) TaxID=1328760 RepID=A0A164ZET8_XYLHT|nr:multi protein bridging factor 1 [Xylona heveae TC161]KZF19013.1 multi protein bridging factor 1 [Xylona heveae TC161]
MSDWDNVTKIGSRVGGSGAAAPREKVVRGNAALNAAQRTGGVLSTDKKYASSNTNFSTGGQRDTKVANSDDIVKPLKVDPRTAKAIGAARQKLGLTQDKLAQMCAIPKADIASYENGSGKPNQQHFNKIENQLKCIIRGPKLGQPKFKHSPSPIEGMTF